MATTLPIPAIAGYAGTFELANNNALAGTTVTLTSYRDDPSGAPASLSVRRAPSGWARPRQATTTVGTAIFWVSQKYSAAVSFQGFPITSWRVPASYASGGPLALETFDGATDTLLDTEFDTGISGNVATFPGSSTTFAVVTGDTYWWELITGKPMPSPSPSTSPSPSSSPSSSPAPLQITSGPPPSGIVGQVYGSPHFYCTCTCKRSGCRHGWMGFELSVSGGTGPDSWSWSAAVGSSGPPGLKLHTEPSEVTAIEGTPTTAGTYRVKLSVTDSGSPAQHASATYTISVYTPPPTPPPSPSPSPT